MGEALVYTTAEIVLGEMEGALFGRQHCEKSGWPELTVLPIGAAPESKNPPRPSLQSASAAAAAPPPSAASASSAHK